MCSAQEAQPDNEIVEKPETLQQQMLGAWVLAGKPDAEIEPKPGARMKFIGLGYWLITQHNPKNGQVIFHHGGTYSLDGCLLYTSPSPRDRTRSRMPSSA